MGLWVAASAFAIAYGRGVVPGTIGVRYYDVLLTGLFASALALARFGVRQRGWKLGWWGGVALAWLVVVALGLTTRMARMGGLYTAPLGRTAEGRVASCLRSRPRQPPSGGAS